MARTGKRPDMEIPGTEILRVLVGSRAHGTANADSDRDERVIFVAPTRTFFEVGRNPKETVWTEAKTDDLTGWELRRFAHLAVHCNPTILEVLWAPVVSSNGAGDILRGIRSAFLDPKRIRDAFAGYSHNQRKKMLAEPEVGWGPRNWKFAEAYLRVMHQGIALLRTRQLPIGWADDPFLRRLMQARRGDLGPGEVIALGRVMLEELHDAFNTTELLESDIPMINRATWEIREGWGGER